MQRRPATGNRRKDMERFKDKVALVTGAASNPGLGRAIAQLLAHEGGKVVVTDVDEGGIADCVAAIKAAGGTAVGWRQDVTSEDDWYMPFTGRKR